MKNTPLLLFTLVFGLLVVPATYASAFVKLGDFTGDKPNVKDTLAPIISLKATNANTGKRIFTDGDTVDVKTESLVRIPVDPSQLILDPSSTEAQTLSFGNKIDTKVHAGGDQMLVPEEITLPQIEIAPQVNSLDDEYDMTWEVSNSFTANTASLKDSPLLKSEGITLPQTGVVNTILRLQEEISDKEKVFIEALGDDGVQNSTTNGKLYKEIKSSGCNNSTIKTIDDASYVCSQNLWLGPLGRDEVFTGSSDTDDAGSVIIIDNYFKEVKNGLVELILNKYTDSGATCATYDGTTTNECTILFDSEVLVDLAGGAYILEKMLYTSKANEANFQMSRLVLPDGIRVTKDGLVEITLNTVDLYGEVGADGGRVDVWRQEGNATLTDSVYKKSTILFEMEDFIKLGVQAFNQLMSPQQVGS